MEKLAGKVGHYLGDMHDIRFINYLVKGNTITVDYYAAFFNHLNKEKMLRQHTGSHIHESYGKI